jgi:tRNA-splicing ligase RtcB
VPDLEGSVLEQATNLSNLPFAIRHVALMPDAHAGYGMPIGGVLFADGAVVPYAIGVDIGCGVVLVETDLTVETLSKSELAATLEAIAAGVPVGTSSQPKAVDRDAALEGLSSARLAWVSRSRSSQLYAARGARRASWRARAGVHPRTHARAEAAAESGGSGTRGRPGRL